MISTSKSKKVLEKLIVSFTIFILVLGVPSFIALCPFIYFNEAQKTNANLSIENSDELYQNVHEFLVYQKTLSDEFTESETSHMNDVRLLFNIFRITSLIFITLIITYLILIFSNNGAKDNNVNNKIENKLKLHKQELISFSKKIRKGAFISLAFFSLLIIFILINFSASFDIFHKIFFPQGNWMFSYDSLLITLFPITFFINISKKIVTISLIIILITILKSHVFNYYLRRRK